jgi:hypothetical protein
MNVLLTSTCWCSRCWCHQLRWWMLIPGEVCGLKPWLPRYACNWEHIYVCNLSPSKYVCVCVRERERGLFFVDLLMWMCVKSWWIWLQGSLDRRIVLSKSFFILLYACLLFFKTCNSAASLSFSNFCVLVALQFFSDWCNCKSVYTMHSLRGLPIQAWLQASSAGVKLVWCQSCWSCWMTFSETLWRLDVLALLSLWNLHFDFLNAFVLIAFHQTTPMVSSFDMHRKTHNSLSS